MEGVGARLGRSSTRYGPTTVFTGPVRKWKKKWIHVTPPSSNNNSNHHHHHQTAVNGTATNGNNGSHLLLYKWTPITASQNNSNNNNNNNNGNNKTNDENTENSKSSSRDDALAAEEPPKRKFKYIPVAVLEEQKNEATEPVEDEAKPMETETNEAQTTTKGHGFDEKPDINDVPAEENQAPENSPRERQDLNESTLDLSLGLKAHDGENDSDPKPDKNKDGQIERVNSSSVGT